MLIDAIRSIVPMRVRQDLGLWTAAQAGKSKYLLYPYYFLLCGQVPKSLVLFEEGTCGVEYKRTLVRAPRDGILAFIEVFQDEIYLKCGRPKEGDVVMDIGAYVGMFTVQASKLVGSHGRVIAVEPAPKNFEYLQKNTDELGNVIRVKKAAFNYVGEGKLSISRASPCHTLIYDHKDGIEVEVITLDRLAQYLGLPKVDFIKIDAEGSELGILEGAETLLRNNKVRLAVAAYHDIGKGKNEAEEVVKFLRKVGYQTLLDNRYVYAERKEK